MNRGVTKFLRIVAAAPILAYALVATPLLAVNVPLLESTTLRHRPATASSPAASLTDDLLTGDLLSATGRGRSHPRDSRWLVAPRNISNVSARVRASLSYSPAVPSCTLSWVVGLLSASNEEQEQDDDEGDGDDGERELDCEGDKVTVRVTESDDGVISATTCVTNGSCEGTWDDYDIEITVEGTACFIVTTRRQ